MTTDTAVPRTRRAILIGALGAALASAAAAIGRPTRVSAADGDVVHVGGSYTATHRTEIFATGADAFFAHGDKGSGGVLRSNSGSGLEAFSWTGYGVEARSSSNVGVYGYSEARDQPAMVGWSYAGHCGVQGFSGGGGINTLPAAPSKVGVFGLAVHAAGNGVQGEASASDGSGVVGINHALGNGVVGQSNAHPLGVNGVSAAGTVGQNTADGAGLWGLSEDGIGVIGQSTTGRGARFAGKQAQLRLVPSQDANHPASGQPGDLFVDATGRLWFCKGGTSWAKLA